MKTFQARLVGDGKIVGYIEIFEGIVRAKTNEDDMFKYYRNELIKFDSLEPLAPFKDKDGGELYAGDKVKCVMFRHDIEGIIKQTNHAGWIIEDEFKVQHAIREYMLPIFKLGTIHDAKGE